MQPMPPSRSHQFGPFRLDAGGRVLYRDGQRVALTPKAVDVLIALVTAHDRLVTKDELLQTVWAGTVVEEGTLASHVSMLRKALGSGLIETLPKRGYRFVGQVAEDSRATRTIAPPTRTMTFLLTAIEDGAARADARSATAEARHDALLRDAITRHGGNILRIDEGAFCVAFADASAAVRAAVDAQRTLCAAEQAAIAVRMGLHSGTVEEGEDRDLGGRRWRARRVWWRRRKAARSLVTATTVALLDRARSRAPVGDLGDHTLRGAARAAPPARRGWPAIGFTCPSARRGAAHPTCRRR
jgi:DNA-binding winged helix-turn-helix (wHTH) protein